MEEMVSPRPNLGCSFVLELRQCKVPDWLLHVYHRVHVEKLVYVPDESNQDGTS